MRLRTVAAREGLTWVRQGFTTFGRQPLAFTGLFFMYLAAMSLLSVVPVLGTLLPLVLVPAATLGFMAAAAQAREGRFPMPTVLLTAFRAGQQRMKHMLVLGVLYGLAIAIVFGLTAFVDGGMLARMLLLGGSVETQQARESGFGRAMIVGLVLYAPVSLAFWHAPALVHWHDMAPAKALFASFVACWRNLRAFVVYAMAWMLVMTGSALVVSFMAVLVMGQPQIAAVAMMPVALFLATVFFASFYATFVGCFELEAPPPLPDVTH